MRGYEEAQKAINRSLDPGDEQDRSGAEVNQ